MIAMYLTRDEAALAYIAIDDVAWHRMYAPCTSHYYYCYSAMLPVEFRHFNEISTYIYDKSIEYCLRYR